MWCKVSPDVLQNATIAALACSAPPDINTTCTAICPNQDISGIGVRSAFYLQSLMNTLLVIFSRRDSVPSTWAATLLTAALVIAAMVQKRNQTITLHHAILTMNFATLSCISSLAVAPTLSIWRLTPREYYQQQLARNVLEDDDLDAQQRMVGAAVDEITGKHRRRIERAQSRQRVFLALALLTQVVLQWSWGVVLFVSPSYGQKNCSGQTQLVFFLAEWSAADVNAHYMFVWVLWLLFSLAITMGMTIVLALTSPARARPATLRSSPASSIGTYLSTSSDSTTSGPRPLYKQLLLSMYNTIPGWKEKGRQLIFWYNILCIVLWLVYIIASEIQIQANCIFQGEDVVSGFGQITALLLSLAPLWSLTVALYKWPELQRRLERRRRREQLPTAHPGPGPALHFSPASPSSPLALRLLDSGGDHTPARTSEDSTNALGAGDAPPVVALAFPSTVTAAPVTVTAAASGTPSAARARTRTRTRPRGARRPPSGHAHTPTLDGVTIARSTTQEWVELATFPVGLSRD